MQPKLRSKVSCSDKEVGELARVVIDPLDREISHLVIKTSSGEVLLPVEGNLSSCTDDHVQLAISSEVLSGMPPFQRDDYVTIDEVEIPHLERHLDVHPGEALVPLPPIEKDMGRVYNTKLKRIIKTITNATVFLAGIRARKYQSSGIERNG